VDLGLKDRVVLITGAGGGVGPTLARAFVAEGATVALQHRGGHSGDRAAETAAGIIAAGGRAITVEAELGAEPEVDAMVADVAERLGPVGVLVTATSAYRMERFAEIEEESWSEVVDDLLGATYRCCRAVVPAMQAAGWGRIVNFAARSGIVGTARSAHYAAAKARDHRPDGVAGEGARSGGDPGQRGGADADPDRKGRDPVDPRRPGHRDGEVDPGPPPRHARRCRAVGPVPGQRRESLRQR